MTAVALIVAAGRGHRAGAGLPKQYIPLAGQPVLRHTIERFLNHAAIDAVRVVIHADDAALYRDSVGELDLLPPIIGGESRQASVRNGLESLNDVAPDLVMIHDAARPFTPAGVTDRVLEALALHDGAIAALPVADTIKRADSGSRTGRSIAETVDRTGLWRAQTPQGFHFAPILAAHRTAAGRDFTDDAAVAEAAGLDVALVAGAEENFKITTAEDIERAEAHLSGATQFDIRTGQGFDVHRFGVGDHVTLCGVHLPHEQGLLGHSDADVGLHSITDALLGAAGFGDIGDHFPPSDPQWKGASSDQFLAHARSLIEAAGGRILNVDVTLVCERPRIGPHRDAMRARIAAILGLSPQRVSVKATTTEGLGFTGRGEGIAAQAVATIACTAKDDSA